MDRWASHFSRLAVLLFVLGITIAQAQVTRYVDDDAPNDNGPGDPMVSDSNENGSVDHPFDAIQEALTPSQNGDIVLVLDGTYTGVGNRDLVFPKTGGAARSITVRSQNGAGVTIIDCGGSAGTRHRGFSFLDDSAPETAVVEGFTITGGYAGIIVNGDHDIGGAIQIVQSDPTIRNCILRCNTASSGGAIGFAKSSRARIEDCIIENNSAVGSGSSGGGGIYAVNLGVLMVIDRCTIRGNYTDSHGGGVRYHMGALATITDSLIEDNEASSGGGVFVLDDFIDGARHSFKRSTIAGNRAMTGDGGGLYISMASGANERIVLAACTVAGNRALHSANGAGGGLVVRGGVNQEVQIVDGLFAYNLATRQSGGIWLDDRLESQLVNNTFIANSTMLNTNTASAMRWTAAHDSSPSTIDNSIAWLGISPQFFAEEFLPPNHKLSVRWSAIQGGYEGAWYPVLGTPQFVLENGTDGVDTTWQDNNYRLKRDSPGVDKGNNTLVPLDELNLDDDPLSDPTAFTERVPIDGHRMARFFDDPGSSNTGSVTEPAYPFPVDVGAYEFGVPSAPGLAPYPHDRLKNRYISFAPNNGSAVVAFRVHKPNCGVLGGPGGDCWVGAPNAMGICQCLSMPTYRAWPEPVIHVGDCEIVPVCYYQVDATSDGVVFSGAPLTLATIFQPTPKYWGDICGSYNGTLWTPPNGIANINDISAVLAYANGYSYKPDFTVANLQANSAGDSCLNEIVNTADVQIAAQAVAGAFYGLPSGPKVIDPALCPVCPVPTPPGPVACGQSLQAGAGYVSGGKGSASAMGSSFSLVVHSPLMSADGGVSVDVFGPEAENISAYEVSLDINGGSMGTVTLDGISIDKERSDYVFGREPVYLIANADENIAGAVLESGKGVSVKGQKYLATFTLKASHHASGAFEVAVNGERSYLLDGDGNRLATSGSEAGLVDVGAE